MKNVMSSVMAHENIMILKFNFTILFWGAITNLFTNGFFKSIVWHGHIPLESCREILR